MSNNINPYTNRIITSKPQERGQYNGYTQNYGGGFGDGKYDSYQSVSSEEPQSFWQKWKKTFIIGGTLIFAGVLSVIGYKQDWLGKLKTKFNSWIDKPKTNSTNSTNSKNNEAQEILKCFEDLSIKDIKLSDGKTTNIQDLIKKDKIEGKDFVTLATCLKNKCDNTKKALIVKILNFFKGKLSVDKVGTFTKSKDIKEDNLDNILKSIIEESGAKPSDSADADSVGSDPESTSSSVEEKGDAPKSTDTHESDGVIPSQTEEKGDGPEVSDTHKPEDVIPSQTEGNDDVPKSLDEIEKNIQNTIHRAFSQNKSEDIEAVKKQVEETIEKIEKAEDKAQCFETAAICFSSAASGAAESGYYGQASKLYKLSAEFYQKEAVGKSEALGDKQIVLGFARYALEKAIDNAIKSDDGVQVSELCQQAAGIEGLAPSEKAEYINATGLALLKAAIKAAKSGDAKAGELYKQAAELCKRAVNVEDISPEAKEKYIGCVCGVLTNMAENAEESGNYGQASELYKQIAVFTQQAADICTTLENKAMWLGNIGICLENMAINAAESGDAKAGELLQQTVEFYQNNLETVKNMAIEPLKKSRWLNEACCALYEVADSLAKSGDYAKARELYKQAAVFAQQAADIEGLDSSNEKGINLENVGDALENMAINAAKINNVNASELSELYQKAANAYQQAAMAYQQATAETKEDKGKFYCRAIESLRKQIECLYKCKNTTEIANTTDKILALYQEAIEAGADKNEMNKFLTEQVGFLNIQLDDRGENASGEAKAALKRLNGFLNPEVSDPQSSAKVSNDIPPEGDVLPQTEGNGDVPEASDVHEPEGDALPQTEGNSDAPESLEEIEQNIKDIIDRAFFTYNKKSIEAVNKQVEDEIEKIKKAEDKAQCFNIAGMKFFDAASYVAKSDKAYAIELYQNAAELYKKAAEIDNVKASELYQKAAKAYQQAARIEGLDPSEKAMYINNAGVALTEAINAAESDNLKLSELYQQAAGIEGLNPSEKVMYINKAGVALGNAAIEAEKSGDYLQASKLYQQAAGIEDLGTDSKTMYLDKAFSVLDNAAVKAAESGDAKASELCQQAAGIDGIAEADKARCFNNVGSALDNAARNAKKSDNVKAIGLYQNAAKVYQQAAGIDDLRDGRKVEYLNKAYQSLKTGVEALGKNELADKESLLNDLSEQTKKLGQQVENLPKEEKGESIEQLKQDITSLKDSLKLILDGKKSTKNGD